MYEIIGNPATRAFRVLWALEELGQPYKLHADMPQSEKARALNPTGKVPILLEGEQTITDSVAIMTYLADKHGALSFAPGTLERAEQDSFTQQILDEVEAPLWSANRHTFVLPQELRVPALKDTLIWEYNRGIHNVMSRRKGPYLMGERFTLPDILLTHCAAWARFISFDSDNTELVPYIKITRARDAFQRLAPKKG
ncbi:glutathione S-transferase family protein [Shimia marina]|uniref:Glutathione S-transferase GST-6.0 n=1 Tax=Shimia marina TaxID=321267 RepID=A0A0P1ELR6_9RHOB|nr:glutathione S-transferase [Shimia marina]CUH51065.1 Glutathione S-transferase GST-6.0 [Shimia marina]SFD58981.1 glutathione S-transferase [Shimia marina]